MPKIRIDPLFAAFIVIMLLLLFGLPLIIAI
jgi:hypothetical protein